MAQFTRYIGIDYSGAETADSSCKGAPGVHGRGLQRADSGTSK